MKKRLLVFITIIAIISVVWINKLYLVDGIENYHNILHKIIFVMNKYVYIMSYQLWKRMVKYANLNISISLIGITYYLSYIFFLKPIENAISVDIGYVFGFSMYFSLFAGFYTLKRDINRK